MYKQDSLVPRSVLKEFFNPDNVVSIRPFGNGHINATFLVTFPTCRYILQRINDDVFENPFAVMNNIELVTSHIRKKVIYEGKDPRTCVLTTVFTRYGQNMAIVDDDYWRCTRFIEEGETLESTTDLEVFKEVGRCVGEFQALLHGFHTRTLVDTIKHFHDTPFRYQTFKNTVKIDDFDRVKECTDEIAFINAHKDKLNVITEPLEKCIIPRRVTHNDTKLNNIMISKTTHKALCLIDLDTVMKGSLLYDYGDALRIGCANAPEDETDLSKVTINFELFKTFTEGYLEAIKEIITPEEINLLVDGYFIICFELGMRFLTDYINGDTYFRLNEKDKTSRPKLNLERAKCQLKLASEVEENYDKLVAIVNEILESQKYSTRITK